MTSPGERRGAERLLGDALPDDLRGRIRPGHPVRVVNVSSRGLLIETSRRLLPGTIVDVHLERRECRHLTRARVVRCQVGVVAPDGLIFRGALECDQPIPWFTDVAGGVGTGSNRHIPESGQ